MRHWTCCECKKRRASNSRRKRIGSRSYYSFYLKFSELKNSDPSSFICPKCDMTLYNRHLKIKRNSCNDLAGDEDSNENEIEMSSTHELESESVSMADSRSYGDPISSMRESESNESSESESMMEDEPYLESNRASQDPSFDTNLGESSMEYQDSNNLLEIESNSEDKMSSKSSGRESSLSTPSSERIKIIGINSAKSTQRACFICNNKTGRKRVPRIAILQCWIDRRVRIPPDNRCCRTHLSSSVFIKSALDQITIKSSYSKMSVVELKNWLSLLAEESVTRSVIDFDDKNLKEEDYITLVGLTKSNFNDLLKYIKEMRKSKNRSINNALAMLLMKIRLNLSHKVLAILFGVTHISCVSETLTSVTTILSKNFTPKYLGFTHKSRQELIQRHSVTSFNTLYKKDSDTLIIIMDGTYVYIEKPSEFDLQSKTWSNHKFRNLVKFMMSVTTTGYIVDAHGPFYADGKNNDASILKQMLPNTSMLSLLTYGDTLVLDRGFRDSLEKIEDYGLYSLTPAFLGKNESKFSTKQGNESRMVTMSRWVVEAINGRIKNVFSFFEGNVRNSYLNSKVEEWFKLSCAILNAYFPPIYQETDTLKNRVNLAIKRSRVKNKLKLKVNSANILNKRIIWREVQTDSIEEFPRLSEIELKELTIGTYQLNLAPYYSSIQLYERSRFELFIHKEKKGLIRAKLQSRYHRAKSHYVWLDFKPKENSLKGIRGYYCACKQGERTIGCCSHIASVVWFLSYGRFNQDKSKIIKNISSKILDCANTLTQNNSSESESESGNEKSESQVGKLDEDEEIFKEDECDETSESDDEIDTDESNNSEEDKLTESEMSESKRLKIDKSKEKSSESVKMSESDEISEDEIEAYSNNSEEELNENEISLNKKVKKDKCKGKSSESDIKDENEVEKSEIDEEEIYDGEKSETNEYSEKPCSSSSTKSRIKTNLKNENDKRQEFENEKENVFEEDELEQLIFEMAKYEQ